MSDKPTFDKVQGFWEKNPLCAWEIPHPIGSREYFERFNTLRAKIEPPSFANSFYEFGHFQGQKVLDVGCGNGWVLSHYAAAGAQVTGIDATPTGVELSKKRFALQGLSGQFQVANAEALPFPDNSFDAVSSMGVLHHVPDTAKAVSEIERVLKPGGRLFLMLYHRNSVLYRFKFPILSLLNGKPRQQLVNEVDGAGNPKGDVYSREEIRALLKNFSDLELDVRLIEGWMTLPAVGKYLPDFLFKPFEHWAGWFLYAKGIKPAAR